MSDPSDAWAWPNEPHILVAGAGAIGGSLATRLAAAGQRVSLLARGATLTAVQAHGLRLDDLDGRWQARVHAAAGAQDLEAPDLLLLCCKSQDLPALAAQVRPLITPRTLIVPCVNGVPFWYFHRSGDRFQGETVRAVDPEGRLGTLLPLEQVLGAVVFITADTSAPAHAVSRTPHLVMLGEPGGGITPRLQAACAVLAAAGIEARPLERIRDKLWTKLIANLTSNPLSVVTGATLQAIYTEPALLATVRQVMHEAMLAASCYGARLEIDPIELLRLGAAMGPVRTSMLQDHGRGRPLELAAIGDAVIELGERYALPMAATRALVEQARRRHARDTTEAATLSLAVPA